MEKTPKFIKEFSREKSPEERKQVAGEIRAKRAEHFDREKSLKAERVGLQESISEREGELAGQVARIEALTEEIEAIESKLMGKLLNYFELRKIKSEMAIGKLTYDELREELEAKKQSLREVAEKLDVEDMPPELAEARKMVDDFYKSESRKWQEAEYTPEEVRELFSEEHLASLSLEEYTLLLKRFPSEMVAHVTRQGVRDHTGHAYHTAGTGAYTDGFMRMVQDGRLRSPLGVYLKEEDKRRAVAECLKLDMFDSREEALQYLDELLAPEQGASGSFSDRMAIHFATEEVADCYYGSEKGNEIFIVYPSMYVASQYHYRGQLNAAGGGYWNDQWVWANEERGMDLNAGIVFIPESTRVDPETGSRYELDEDLKPKNNEQLLDVVEKFVNSPGFPDFADEVMKITGEFHGDFDNPRNEAGLQKLLAYREVLMSAGITDERVQNTVMGYQALFSLHLRRENQDSGDVRYEHQSIRSGIKDALQDAGILFVEAGDTITSKEYWEKYFDQNPAKKPSKIVYYNGSDPTQALRTWRQEQGLDKRSSDSDMGFKASHVDGGSPVATAGLDRFRPLAEQVLDEHFSKREVLSAT